MEMVCWVQVGHPILGKYKDDSRCVVDSPSHLDDGLVQPSGSLEGCVMIQVCTIKSEYLEWVDLKQVQVVAWID